MSFQRISAILRNNWMVDKQWANTHLPLVYSFLKGDTAAATVLMGGENDAMDDDTPIQLAGNVYKINVRTNVFALPANSIAYVDIDGPLFKAGDACSDGMADFAELFYRLKAASNIVGVILDIDSPGGQVDGTATLADAIKQCTLQKPVIGFVDDGMSCSAAYWVLSACTEIYCSQPTDAVGSIGVYCTIADWNAYYAHEGLPVKDVYAPESTDKNIEYREAINGNDTPLQNDLSFIAQTFIKTVETNRAGKLKSNDWKTGATFFAKDALAMGLIDGIKGFDYVLKRTNRFIHQQKNTNMAFEKTLAVAMATAFAVTDEGFALSEEHLNNIETALTNAAQQEATIAQLNDTITALQATGAELVTTNSNQATTIATQAKRIAELEQLVAQYGSQASGNGTTFAPVTAEAAATADEGKPKYVSALDDPNHPLNQMADGITSGIKRSI